MAKQYVISERDYLRLQNMLRWFDRNKNQPNRFRRRGAVPLLHSAGLSSSNRRIVKVNNKTKDKIKLYDCTIQTLDYDGWGTNVPALIDVPTTGPWEEGVNYLLESTVTYDGKVYICNTAHRSTSYTTPSLSSHWDRVYEWGAAADAWVTAHNYVVEDSVTEGGLQYLCITAHFSSAGSKPPNANYWLRIYIVDQYAWHTHDGGGRVYRCITAHDTAKEPPNAGYWIDNDSLQVLNIVEELSGMSGESDSSLVVGDFMIAHSFFDDENNKRWAGMPTTPIHRTAYVASIDTSGYPHYLVAHIEQAKGGCPTEGQLGYGVEVKVLATQMIYINSAFLPHIEVGDSILVTWCGGRWYLSDLANPATTGT